MTQLSLLDIAAILLGVGLLGAWSTGWTAVSWVGFALLLRWAYPRRVG